MRVAAVDVGTNTVRSLVADVADGIASRVSLTREITRLGQGVDDARRLHPDAVERTVSAIARAVEGARGFGAERIRVTGTSALRDAADREDLVTAVERRAGVGVDVIGGDEEARLSLLGATSELPPGDHTVCDIGGGSTELSSEAGSVSCDVGSVRLFERCLHSDPPSPSQVAAARAAIDEALDGVGFVPSGTLVGVAGTVTSLAALVAGLRAYDPDAVHHSRLSVAEVASWSDRLLGMRAADIAAIGPVETGRADVLPAGVLILRRVMERFGFGEVLVSERDILDGLVLDLAHGG